MELDRTLENVRRHYAQLDVEWVSLILNFQAGENLILDITTQHTRCIISANSETGNPTLLMQTEIL